MNIFKTNASFRATQAESASRLTDPRTSLSCYYVHNYTAPSKSVPFPELTRQFIQTSPSSTTWRWELSSPRILYRFYATLPNQGGDTPYTLARRFLNTPERRHVPFPCALSAIAAWRFSKELYNSSEKIIYSEASIECNGPGLCSPYTQTQWQSAICKRDSSWISNVKGPEPVLPVPAMGATKYMWERIIH